MISRFDVVAVQESRRNPKALKHLLTTLGPQWQINISDVTEGSTGNGERLAYVYDTDRVQPSGLAGEPDLLVEGIGKALRAILTHIPHRTWVTFSAFGGAVCSHFEGPTRLSKVVGAPVWEWSLETARKYGFTVELSDNKQSIRLLA